MFQIPLRQLPNDTTSVLIDGIVLKINTMWNSPEQAWYISIYDVSDNALILGQKMLQTQNITRRHGLIEFIDGDLYCVNRNPKQARPVYEDIGTKLILVYMTKEETAQVEELYSDIMVYV